MKPPKLNKLSKKELKKLYSNQWNQNIIAVWENYNLNEALQRAEKQMKEYVEQVKERIAEKEKMVKFIGKIGNWNVVGFEHIKEGELILVMDSYFQDKMKALEEAERDCRKYEEEIEDWKEATRRSRNLVQTYKEFAERKNPESVSIEKMAKNLYNTLHRYVQDTFMDWDDLEENIKDTFRVDATRIISEDPDKKNSPN